MEEVRAWRNDHRIWQWTRQNDLIADIEQKDWFDQQAKDPTIKMYRLVLSDGESARTVGVCGFTSIDYRNGRAEFSLYIAPGFQRQGLGRRSLGILLAHGFENHGFRLIWGETFDGNPAAKVFETLGFKKEGTRRAFYYKGGKYLDAHLYSILKEEWLYGRVTGPAADPAADRGSDQRPDDRLPARDTAPSSWGPIVEYAPKKALGQAGKKAKAEGPQRRRLVGQGTERKP